MITLATLAQATEQEIFNHVARHLITQGVVSRDRVTDMCTYRDDFGNRCAAGCLIADEEYDASMETLAWHQLVSLGRVPKEHQTLIGQLQQIHDGFDDEEEVRTQEPGEAVHSWRRELRRMAEEYDFDTLVLDTTRHAEETA